MAVNLYPFRETVAKGGVGIDEAMEKVDIGGPTMIRAAAKNHADVWVVVDPADYPTVLEALDGKGDPAALRRALAAKVFRHVGGYDAAVAAWLGEGADAEALPEDLPLGLRRVQTLRYGENPDQEAAFYGFGRRSRADRPRAAPRQGAQLQQPPGPGRCAALPRPLRVLAASDGVHRQAHDALRPGHGRHPGATRTRRRSGAIR